MDNMSEQEDDAQGEPSTSTDGTKSGSAILDGKFFSIVFQTSEGKVQAECQLCTQKKVVISGTLAATLNFKTHLKRLHPESLFEFERHKKQFPCDSKKTKKTPFRQTHLSEQSNTG